MWACDQLADRPIQPGRRARATRRHLVLGGRRADVGVEAAAEAVTRSTGTGCVLPGSAARRASTRSFTCLAEVRVGRPEVRAAGVQAVVGHG